MDQLKNSALNTDRRAFGDYGWPIISPNGNISGVCSRNILAIGGDKSNFYKYAGKMFIPLKRQASTYLIITNVANK